MTELSFSRTDGIADQYGYRHRLVGEVARGGQGVVYRTTDPDIAIKQPLNASGEVDAESQLDDRYRNIRYLPLPPRIPISLPVAVLRDEPGYVMKLLNEMVPFSAFALNGAERQRLGGERRPDWLAGIEDQWAALSLFHYSRSGSTKRRLGALSQLASILARLHAGGLVYCDVSPNNCFMSEDDSGDVWLIDADNLRFEMAEAGASVYTPQYGAPEVVQGLDRSRMRSDVWSFAVMAFETLSLLHPFVGAKVLSSDDDGNWEVDSPSNGGVEDLYTQAFSGFLSFIDDENDDSNQAVGGLPRPLIFTSPINNLFREAFVAGRLQPWRRPAMALWALEFARAHDQSIVCPSCSMSYFVDRSTCPYCDTDHPDFAILATDEWHLVVQKFGVPIELPDRLFTSFSLERNTETRFEAIVDADSSSATHVRGTNPLPSSLEVRVTRRSR